MPETTCRCEELRLCEIIGRREALLWVVPPSPLGTKEPAPYTCGKDYCASMPLLGMLASCCATDWLSSEFEACGYIWRRDI